MTANQLLQTIQASIHEDTLDPVSSFLNAKSPDAGASGKMLHRSKPETLHFQALE